MQAFLSVTQSTHHPSTELLFHLKQVESWGIHFHEDVSKVHESLNLPSSVSQTPR